MKRGIPGDLFRTIRAALLDCAPDNLAPVMKDQRLYPWRYSLPAAGDRIGTIDGIIAFLYEKERGDSHENALYLLLQVLEERSLEDACQNQLRQAREQLAYALAGHSVAPLPPPARDNLERIVREKSQFLDVVRWRTALAAIENQVCRIDLERHGKIDSLGTGFLVGPDLVLTNHHVVSDTIDWWQKQPHNQMHWARASQLIIRFDHKQLADGTTINEGTPLRLADNWLVDASPPSAVDRQIVKSGLPAADELDYALLRLGTPAGDQPLAGSANNTPRSWIPLPSSDDPPAPGEPLIIMQHPAGQPLKLAFESDGVIGLNANRTRITYRTNTEHGSSGSPCFNANWQLVALHHSGDPDYSPNHRPDYNEGIPIAAIVRLLTQRGIL